MTAGGLQILLAASEAVPFTKTGGLGDVAGALALALSRLGHRVALVIPAYGVIDRPRHGLRERLQLDVPTFSGMVRAGVDHGRLENRSSPHRGSVDVFAIAYEPFFGRPGLYMEDGRDYPDNLERFAFFSRAVLELVVKLHSTDRWRPHVLHANDWQTALSVVYRRRHYAPHAVVRDLRTLFTVHNLAYQGSFPRSDHPKTDLPPDLAGPEGLGRDGSICLLKGGLLYADFLSTVSPTYSREIQTPQYGFGLDDVLRRRRHRLVGIMNGVDVETWDPATDPYLPARFTVQDLSGKGVCKAAVQRELDLPVRDVPLLAMVSRLDRLKGLDLVAEILPELLKEDVQVVLLGTGDPGLEARFRGYAEQHRTQVGLRIGFDDGLAHRLIAGADLFLMPSRYEPCGLTDLYSLRYGTVPIVTRTGGLTDAVRPYPADALSASPATGFHVAEAEPAPLLAAIRLALRLYTRDRSWRSLVEAGMRTDVSWTSAAEQYSALYDRLLRQPGDGSARERSGTRGESDGPGRVQDRDRAGSGGDPT